MGHAKDQTLVLTYHSISDHDGPTSIAPATFRMQLETLARCGYQAVASEGLIASRDRTAADCARQVLITFDDGYTNFADAAVPELVKQQLPSLVFIPTGMMGGRETWTGAHPDKRPLMSWDQVRELAAAKVEFGSHAVSHRDLTRLSPAEVEAELAGSAQTLFDELGYRPRTFAAPYGAVNAEVLKLIPKYYAAAFGVQMDRATHGYSIFNLPRIDMHYFRDAGRWRSFLNGADGYFQARRGLRALKSSVTKLVAAPGKRSPVSHGT